MKTVWKFNLQVTDWQAIAIPNVYELLCVQVQYGTPCIWALVDPSTPVITIDIITHGTGRDCFDVSNAKYIGSYQLNGGNFVGHVWGVI